MATQERLIETPVGTRLGKIFENLDVLGVGSFFTQSGNQSSAHKFFKERADIEVPVGTFVVIPSPNLWFLGHGNLQPEFLDPLDENQEQIWHPADHHWGAGAFQVAVMGVNAPDFSQNPPRQTAHLDVTMILTDDNGDDSWFGIGGYSLLYLGNAPRPHPHPHPDPTGAAAQIAPRRMLKTTKIR